MTASKRTLERDQLLFNAILEILFRHDPIGINFKTNTDEYAYEARTIRRRLKRATCEADALRAIHDVFVGYFGKRIAGPRENYAAIASEVWKLWDGHS